MKLLSIALIIFIYSVAIAQENTNFNYNYPYSWPYDCNSMIIYDSNYYIAGDIGRVESGCGSITYGFHITKIDSLGVKDTTLIFDKCEQTSYMGWKGSIKYKDSCMYIMGHAFNYPNYNKLFFLKLDSKLDTVSNIFFMDDTITKRAFSFVFDDSDNIVFCGGGDSTYNEMIGFPETTYSKSYLCKVSQSGEIIWKRSYSFGDIADGCWSSFHRVIKTFDNGYLTLGRTTDFGNSDNLILKTDSLGNQEWVRFYGSSIYSNPTFTDIIETRDSCFIICGAFNYGEVFGGLYPYDAWVFKLDNDGIIQWSKKHRDSITPDATPNDFYGYYMGVVENDIGDLYTVCRTKSDEDQNYIGSRFRIRCLDSLGNKKWDKIIDSLGGQVGILNPQSILLTDVGNIAVGGWAEIYYLDDDDDWVSDQRIFLVKTDTSYIDTSTNSIIQYTPKPITNFAINCYPNPSISAIYIEVPEEINEDVLVVYSTNGTLVHEQKVIFGVNRIDLCNFKPGMYLLRLRDSGLYGKLVVK